MYNYAETLTEHKYKCRGCGKLFEIPYYCVEWGYWYAGQICCSHRCMMAMRRKDRAKMDAYSEKPPVSRSPLSHVEIENIERLILKGHSNEKIAIAVRRSKSAVGNVRKRMVREGRWTTTR